MFKVFKFIEGAWYYWGTYSTKERAQEVCSILYNEYGIIAKVEEV
jgi:hypothetical protein